MSAASKALVMLIAAAVLGACETPPMSTTTSTFRDSQMVIKQYESAPATVEIGLVDAPTRSIEAWNEAASQGDPVAHRLLGNAYWRGSSATVNGVDPFPKNLQSALWYYERGAELGDVPSQYFAALAFEKGEGTEADGARALALFQRSARGGFPEAHAKVGYFAFTGTAMAKDVEQAMKHWWIAGDAGVDWAQYNLGVVLLAGDGVDADPKAAADWFRMAADQGHTDAMVSLAKMLRSGDGIGQDEAASQQWLQIAAEAGNEDAQALLTDTAS